MIVDKILLNGIEFDKCYKGSELLYEVQRSTGPEMVDLGLPSGTLWAKCNIGAETEFVHGKYFAWGDVEGFAANEVSGKFSDSWYNSRPGHSVTSNITDDDVAHNAALAEYGEGYTMPSTTDFNELINTSYVDTQWTTISGVKGLKISKKNDSSTYIFLPASGYVRMDGIKEANTTSCVWSSNYESSWFAYYLNSGSNTKKVDEMTRLTGASIRAIKRQA